VLIAGTTEAIGGSILKQNTMNKLWRYLILFLVAFILPGAGAWFGVPDRTWMLNVVALAVLFGIIALVKVLRKPG